MKTAISIPTDVFMACEVLAKERGLTRSRLYVLALNSYLEQERGRKITDEYNRVYANEKAEIDPVLKKLQAKALRHSEW